MTAPAAPYIKIAQFGGLVRVMWYQVDAATDYNVYLDNTTAPTLLQTNVLAAAAQPNGWFAWWSSDEQIGQVFVRVTARNVGAEESAYSNEVYRNMTSHADESYMDDITEALDHIRKI